MRQIHASTAWLGFSALLLVGGCGGPGGGSDDADDDDDDGVAILLVTPGDTTLNVIDGIAVSQPYSAVLRAGDGSEQDVTAEVAFSLSPAQVGHFEGATLIATGAGLGEVRAELDGVRGGASVTVFTHDHRVVEGAPADAADLFDGAVHDPGRAMAIVYPTPDSVMPRNLGDFDVHWTDASGADLFEISLHTFFAETKVYVAVTAEAGAWLAFLEPEWRTIAHSIAGDDIDVTVRGLTIANPQTVGRASLQVSTSLEDIIGGIYYWAAASAVGSPRGIFRHDMSRPGEPAEQFYTETEAGRCVACHALSPDGTRMAVTYVGGDGPSNIIDVASRATVLAVDDAWNFASFHPDGDLLLVTHQGVLTIRDASDGAVLATPDVAGFSTHPDISPRGDQVVYVQASAAVYDWEFSGGAVVTRSYDRDGQVFGIESLLVTSTDNNYYPSLSPDGQWVLFNRSSEDSYDDASAELWVVKVDGSLDPIRLDAADAGAAITNSWARWAPFEDHHGPDGGEPIFWLTFSSKRDFGVRLIGQLRPQIWMSAFFPQRAEQGLDPTAPAFRLPFQDLDSSNHIAQWTQEVVPIE